MDPPIKLLSDTRSSELDADETIVDARELAFTGRLSGALFRGSGAQRFPSQHVETGKHNDRHAGEGPNIGNLPEQNKSVNDREQDDRVTERRDCGELGAAIGEHNEKLREHEENA